MKKIFSFLAVAAFLVPGALSADECFSEKGIAANFVDILGKWKKSESRVEIDSIAGGLRFTFFTGVRERKFPVNPAKPDTPAVLGKESVEIQICPDPASGVYYHIGVNPSGTLYTARKRDTSWEPRQVPKMRGDPPLPRRSRGQGAARRPDAHHQADGEGEGGEAEKVNWGFSGSLRMQNAKCEMQNE